MNVKILVQKIIRHIKGNKVLSIDELRARGVIIGNNCHIYGSVDNGHEFLVTIGNNVTLASGCRLFTHDGSTKKIVGYSRVGRIDIGNDVFCGAYSIILPNVKIGNKVIIGAGTVVTKNIPDNSVVVGNPARIIGKYDEYVKKTEEQMKEYPIWNNHYTNKSLEDKQMMKLKLLESGYGFDI